MRKYYDSEYIPNGGVLAEQKTVLQELKENVVETIYSHYKASGGYTRTAAVFIEKITGEKWERDKELESLEKENDALKKEVEELKYQLGLAAAFVPKDWEWNDEENKFEY
jgi:hypothetical protein